MFAKFCLFVLYCLIPFSLQAKYELSICAIFQDEGPYLKEWMEFHKLQGVQHFYLYNNNSQDDFRLVLEPYLKSQEVTLSEWPYTYQEGAHAEWIAIQAASYMDCIKQYGSENRWIAFIDPDEFLFCPNGDKLPTFLKEYKRYGGVCVNWVKFGTSQIEDIPADALLIETLTRCSTYRDTQNRLVKSIVKPKYVAGCKSAHYFDYVPSKHAVDSNYSKMPFGNFSKGILLDKIRINHYWTRTEKYFREKKMPSRMKRWPEFTAEKQLTMVEKYNHRSDAVILQFVPQLKKVMKLSN